MANWVEIEGEFYNLDHIKRIDLETHYGEEENITKFEIIFHYESGDRGYPYEYNFDSHEEAIEEVRRILGL